MTTLVTPIMDIKPPYIMSDTSYYIFILLFLFLKLSRRGRSQGNIQSIRYEPVQQVSETNQGDPCRNKALELALE